MAQHVQGQEQASAAKNAGFFADNRNYARFVGSLETYRQVRRVIDREIAGVHRMLDVGNGGVFDYDTRLAEQIVGVDLFLHDTSPSPASNITLRRGDALALQEPTAAYDAVLECSVFHHLVGPNVESTLANVRRAVRETHRVLAPGGRLIVVESCVSALAFAFERHLFGPLRLLARTPLMRHPATLQFPSETIAEIIRERFGNVTSAPIPVGALMLQFGVPWPTILTPARMHLFTATRS
ncbi:MAG TPA: class I SAM-dependent methyltransferase [Solirubrobacteraceae bacterium]|jgi:SAM-dependent methyltransferase